MRVPNIGYTKDTFLEYITNPSNKVFTHERRRRWLKIYCILVSDEKWLDKLAPTYNIIKLGQVIKLTPRISIEEYDGNLEEYYVIERSKGLLLLYTTATNEDFNTSLGRVIDRTRGMTRLWVKPHDFKRFWKKVISEPDRIMNRFTSWRSRFDERQSQIRPNYSRRFSYTGYDGNVTADELEELYGVVPESVYIEVSNRLIIHADNNGLFSAQRPSVEALSFFEDYLELLIDKSLALKNISQSINYEVVEIARNTKSISIDAASIRLKQETFDEDLIKTLQKEMENFSFIDANMEVGSLSFTATVIDNLKRTVFDVNITESEISIVPKYQSTFESYINFFRQIVEIVDGSAELVLVE